MTTPTADPSDIDQSAQDEENPDTSAAPTHSTTAEPDEDDAMEADNPNSEAAL